MMGTAQLSLVTGVVEPAWSARDSARWPVPLEQRSRDEFIED